jgi:phosphoserine phosphatase
MTQEIKNPQIFSGLILLTSEDKAGLADSLFEALSPFAVSIIDIDQIIIKGRLFLTLQISLNPDHQEAIEEDMTQLAEQLQVDIACIFNTSEIPQDRENLVVVTISANKMLPRYMRTVTQALVSAGANIESFNRISTTPMVIDIHVSGAQLLDLKKSISDSTLESELAITVA